MSRRLDHMAEQGQAAAELAADLLAPGLREKFARFMGQHAPAADADARDVVVPAEGACETCDGAGELTNVRGRVVPCPDPHCTARARR